VVQQELTRAREPLLRGRLAPLARRLAEMDRAFIALAAPSLPSPARIGSMDLPRANSRTRPWDRTPLVVLKPQGYLVDGRPVLEGQDAALERALTARMHNDTRRHITVVAERSTLSARLLVVGRIARLAGANTMGLGVVRQVAARPVPGDVQRLVFQGRPVLRLEEIPVSLRLLSSTGGSTRARATPQGLDYDPRSAQGQLSVFITREGVHRMSRDERLPVVTVR